MRVFISKARVDWTLYTLYGVFLLILYKVIGPQFEGESQKYIQVAEDLSMSRLDYILGQYTSYLTHIIYVKTILVLFKNKLLIAGFNIVLSVIGAELIYRATDNIFKSKRAAFIAKALTLFCYPVQFWTLSAYSEPLFIFLSILLFYIVTTKGFKPFLVFFFISVLLLFTRPQGMFFVCYFWVYYFAKSFGLNVIRLSTISALVLIFIVLFIDVDPNRLKELLYAEPILVSEHKEVWFSNGIRNAFQAYGVLLGQMGWKELLTLSSRKLLYYFVMIRDYYSWFHNLIFGVYSVYLIIGVVALWNGMKTNRQLVIVLSYILFFNIFMTLVFWNAWHNRFNILLLPILSVFIAGSADALILRYKNYGRELEVDHSSTV